MLYVAIKMDVVRSRQAKDRPALQQLLFTAVEDANHRFRDVLSSRFTVTHGDELQGMLPVANIDASIPICEHFIDILRPYDVRFGLGIGKLSTPLRRQAIGMDGETWHRAQSAIDQARRERRAWVIHGPKREPYDALTAITDYLLSHRLRWTENQREAVTLLASLGSQQAVASHLKISKAAVSKRLSGCLWDKYDALRAVAIKGLSTASHPHDETV